MDIMQSPLGEEISRVVEARQPPGLTYTGAVIHAGDEDVEVYKVLNLDDVADYQNQYTSEITIAVVVPAGQFAYRIQPKRSVLELTIYAAPSTQDAIAPGDAQNRRYERFRAILQEDTSDATLEANGQKVYDEMTLDISDFKVIKLQLFSKAMEQFGQRTVGNLWRKTPIESIVKKILMGESARLNLDKDYAPKGINMVPALDAKPREHCMIPDATPAKDALAYLHKNCGGIYSAGLSYFYQNDYWHVFPTYDNTRFETSQEQLVIVRVPAAKMPSVEYTYLQQGGCLTILATGDGAFSDSTDSDILVAGNGVRFTDAASFFDNPAKIQGNKATVSRAKNNNEFVPSLRENGMNNVLAADDRITANALYESSKLAARHGSTLQVQWENANPNLLVPGMQVKILYLKDGYVAKRYACLVGVHTSTAWTGRGLLAGQHVRTVALNLFVQDKEV